jgi:hypothetical protein
LPSVQGTTKKLSIGLRFAEYPRLARWRLQRRIRPTLRDDGLERIRVIAMRAT